MEYEYHIPAGSVAAAEAVFDGWRCHEHDGTTEPDANDILSDLLEYARELTDEDRATAIDAGQPPRCSWCDAPLLFIDGRTHMPHLSWCPRHKAKEANQ